MELKTFFTVFAAVFLAELGDKTQIATFMFAARETVSYLTVFAAASLALVAATGIGVLAGAFVADHVDPRLLAIVAGSVFIVIGAWTIWQAL